MVSAIREFLHWPRIARERSPGPHNPLRVNEDVLDLAHRHLTGDDFGNLVTAMRVFIPHPCKIGSKEHKRELWTELGRRLISASQQTTGVTQYIVLKLARDEMLRAAASDVEGAHMQAFIATLELYYACKPAGVIHFWIGVTVLQGVALLKTLAEQWPDCFHHDASATLKVTRTFLRSVPDHHQQALLDHFLPGLLNAYKHRGLRPVMKKQLLDCIKIVSPNFNVAALVIEEAKKDR